jgi:hypothetical protein
MRASFLKVYHLGMCIEEEWFFQSCETTLNHGIFKGRDVVDTNAHEILSGKSKRERDWFL